MIIGDKKFAKKRVTCSSLNIAKNILINDSENNYNNKFFNNLNSNENKCKNLINNDINKKAKKIRNKLIYFIHIELKKKGKEK